MKSVIIFGTGSMARVMYSFVSKRRRVVAFCADDEYVYETKFMGLPLLKFSELTAVARAKNHIMLALGYHEMNLFRAARFNALQSLGYKVQGHIHPSLLYHDNVVLDSTAVIYDNVAIHAGSVVEQNVFISSNVSLGHDCKIGAHAWINSGVSLAGGVEVGERCVFGINSCVAQGVTLGAGTFVGANTLVTRDTEADAVVVSEAGKMISSIDSKRFIKLVGQP